MGTCIASGLCCCFGCCCQSCSDACTKLLGKERVTKLFYFLLVIIFVVPAIFVFFFLNQWTGFLQFFNWGCPQGSGGSQFECIGASAVYRLSLSLLCLFFLMMVMMLCRNRCAMIINQGLFCFKYIFVFAIFVAFLWVPNQNFSDYADASKVISIGFMIIQSIILIDLFYLAGIKLVKRFDDGQSCCACVLIILSIIFEAIAIGLNVAGYIEFSSSDNCGNSLWINIVTSLIIVLLPFTQLLNFNKQNSLLTTALVSMYISYLCFIAQYSFGGSSCVGRMTTGSLVVDIIVSGFFFILTMYGSIMGGSGVKVTRNNNLNQAVVGKVEGNEGQEQEKKQNQPQIIQNRSNQLEETPQTNLAKYTESCNWVRWHFIMCLASIYIGMLITNWTSASIITGELNSNDFGFWVRVVISWLTALLYLWTLIAPRLFPDRDFTVQ